MTARGNSGQSGAKNAVRPLAIGAVISVIVTLVLMAVISLAIVIMRSITHSSILPLSLAAAGIGCFAGAYACACMYKRRGTVFGAVIGLTLFLAVWAAGAFCSQPVLGTENAVKLLLLVMCGSFGGYAGNRGRSRQKYSIR